MSKLFTSFKVVLYSRLNSHSFIYFIVRLGSGLFTFATLFIFTRLLSPTEYGLYSLGMAITTVSSGLLFQWLNFSISRHFPSDQGNQNALLNFVSRWFWIGAAFAALLFVLALQFFKVQAVSLGVASILFLIVVALGRHTLALQLANAERNPFRYGMLAWSKSGVALGVGILLVESGIGYRAILLGFLAGLLFAVILFAPDPMLLRNHGTNDKMLSNKMFIYGMPLVINNLAIAVVDVIDRFLIAYLLGVQYVAPYAVAYDFVQLSIGPLMNVFFMAIFPLIVQEYDTFKNNSIGVNQHLGKLGSRLIDVGLPTVVLIGLFSNDIADTMFGIDYRTEASTVMPCLALAIFIGSFKNYYLDVVFQLKELTKYQGFIAILMALVNVVLNLILLPYFGLIAASWATLASFTVGAIASFIVGKSLLRLPLFWNSFWKGVSASTIMMCIFFFLPSTVGLYWLLVKLIVLSISYAVMAWLLNIAGLRRSSLK